jgi:hypothetical protein
MARASSATVCLEVRSRATGATQVVTERTWYRATAVNGRLIRTPLMVEIKDVHGRTYEHVGEWLIRCVSSGETMDVLGVAPSIRPAQKLR